MPAVLIIEDESGLREVLRVLLTEASYEVLEADTLSRGREKLEKFAPPVVITDLKLPDGSGMEILEQARQQSPSTQVILMTAFGTTETAVEAMKKGAYDYISKPFKLDELLALVEKALEKTELVLENRTLRAELAGRVHVHFEQLVGNSPKIREVLDLVKRVAASPTTVLISGESGTGKEMVARALHYLSPRARQSFVPVNCGAIPEHLLESEMFGHLRGSFTGALRDKKGLVEEARGGTLFLDEVAELPLPMQVKLLRVLQDHRIKPVGGTTEIAVDLRVIAASNRNLEQEVRDGRFRDDLFYRLNVINIALPPLRERREDIPALARHFLKRYSARLGKLLRGFAPEAEKFLQEQNYPGNVRQLENIVERAVTLSSEEWLGVDLLSQPAAPMPAAPLGGEFWEQQIAAGRLDFEAVMGAIERDLLLAALKKTNGHKTDAARLLGLTFRSLRYRLRKYGLDREWDGAAG